VIGVGYLIPAVMTLFSPFRRIRQISDVAVDGSGQVTKE
jgi:hypothetical protein